MKNSKIFPVLLSVFILAICSGYLYSQVYPFTVWNKIYNAPSNLQDSSVAIATNQAGMLFVAGWSLGTSTNKDIACVRYNPANGDTIWAKRYIGAAEDVVTAMAVNNNAVYLTGWSFTGPNRDLITMKLNSANGDTLWVKKYNGPGNGGDYGLAIKLDGSGNPYVCGRVGDVGNTNHYVVIKYDQATGNFAANYPFIYSTGLASNADEAHSIDIDGSGNIIVTGKKIFNSVGDIMTLKLDNGGNLIWAKTHTGPGDDNGISVRFDNAGAFVFVGGWSFRSFLEDYVVIKYNAVTGDSVAFASYNGPTNGTDRVTSMTIDGSNNITVTGNSLNVPGIKYEIATVRYNSGLVQQWAARTTNSQGWDFANHIITGPNNDLYVEGSTQRSGQGWNMFTIRYNASTGDTIWTKMENGNANANDFGSQVAVMDSSAIYVTGSLVNNPPGSIAFYTLRYSNELLGIRPITGEVPKDFNVYQNYPNPFNPVTTVKFEVPKASFVKITVFSVLGKEVGVIANEQLPAGKYEAVWDASGFASGVYFFKFTAGDFSTTRKMILSK